MRQSVSILSRFCRPDVERPRRPPRAQSSEFRSVNVACVLMRNRTLRPVSDADGPRIHPTVTATVKKMGRTGFFRADPGNGWVDPGWGVGCPAVEVIPVLRGSSRFDRDPGQPGFAAGRPGPPDHPSSGGSRAGQPGSLCSACSSVTSTGPLLGAASVGERRIGIIDVS